MKGRMRVWLELARISNLPTVWTNVLAGWLLAGGQWDWWSLGWLLAGGSLLYTGGMFLNDAADAKWDRDNRSERPIAEGRVSAKAVWVAALIFLVGGLAMVLVGGANLWVALGLVAAIVGYDLYHKPWKGSVVIMGLCRVLLYLTAGSAVVEEWEWTGNSELILKALALGGYVVGLSLVARGEAVSKGGEEQDYFSRYFGMIALSLPFVVLWMPGWGMISVGLLVMMFVTGIELSITNAAGFGTESEKAKGRKWRGMTILLFGVFSLDLAFDARGDLGLGWTGRGIAYGVGLLVGFVVMFALRRMSTPPKSNIGQAVGLLLAGIPVVDALAIVRVNPWLAVGFVASVPLLRWWQRKIAAT